MAWQGKALVALAEDLTSSPSTYMVSEVNKGYEVLVTSRPSIAPSQGASKSLF